MSRFEVEIVATPIDIARAMRAVGDDAHGAIDLFVGTVRNEHLGRAVTGISYDVHKTLAEKALADICHEAVSTWPEARCYVAHSCGDLKVGEASIVIAVSTPHRAESFEVCRYIIEEIKRRAPIWKQEHYTDGLGEWLPGHSLRMESDMSQTCCGACGGGRR